MTAVTAAAVAVVVIGALAVTGWREHWPPAVFGQPARLALTWSPAEAPLPANAAGTASQSAGLNDVACPSVQSCVTVGYYFTRDNPGENFGSTWGLIETLSHGTWTPAAAPVDVPFTQVTFFQLGGVTCRAEGTCVAVGSYGDTQNTERPLVETLSDGSWTPATPALPAGANQKAAFLSQVACPAPGTCVATGWYTAQNGASQGLIETLSNGTWVPATAPLPADAVPSNSSSKLPTALIAVKCPAVGTCVATGEYTDQNGGTQGLIDTLSNGTWTAAKAPLPAGQTAANPNAYLWGVACPAPGTCIAVGHYTARNGGSQGLIDTLSGDRWTPANAPWPTDAAANQKWNVNQPTGLEAAACTAASMCVAAGSYTARNGTVQGEIDTLSNGTWTAARASLPAGAAAAKQEVFFNSAACPAAGSCIAVGSYKAQSGNSQALIETAGST